MSNSSLVTYTKISPHKTSPRNNKIKKITIHHMAGNLSVEECGEVFQTREASANYGINGKEVGLYVDEADRAWSTSNGGNDHQAVNIELANDEVGGDWHVSDETIKTCILLCADICKRNGIKKLVFNGNKSGNLTQHNYFEATACPGPYLKTKFKYIADEVNKILKNGLPTDGDEKPEEPELPPTMKTVDEVAQEVIAGKWGNGDEREKNLEAAGYNYDEVQDKVNEILLGTKPESKPQPTPKPVDDIPKMKEVKASKPAGKYDAKIAKTYIVNAKSGLNIRDGAGTNYNILVSIPYGTKVQNYGYYSEGQGLKWLYVAFEYNNVRYIGFASAQWLS